MASHQFLCLFTLWRNRDGTGRSRAAGGAGRTPGRAGAVGQRLKRAVWKISGGGTIMGQKKGAPDDGVTRVNPKYPPGTEGAVVAKRTFGEHWLAWQARRAGKDENDAIASYRLRKEADSFARQAEQARVAALPPEKPVKLWSLGVSIEHGGVYTLNTAIRKRLGDLANATAQMGSTSSSKHTLGAAAGAAVNPVTLPLAPFL